jgi:hypothetical protein
MCVRVAHGEAQLAEHSESRRACHLVNEVRADEELCLPVGQSGHGMCVPNLFVERLSHDLIRKM